MKKITLILLLISTIPLLGQSDSIKQSEQYFEFKAVPKGLLGLGYDYNISIIFGQNYLSEDTVIKAKSIESVQSFSKVEDVFEFMNGLGWTLVTAFATSHEHYYTYFYIMKREIKTTIILNK